MCGADMRWRAAQGKKAKISGRFSEEKLRKRLLTSGHGC
jgi:hypothetical protein